MIENLPAWIELIFIAAAIFTIVMFYYANGKPKLITGIIILWSAIQSLLGYIGFYQVNTGFPPRFAIVLLPTILLIAWAFNSKGRQWIKNNREINVSTFLHIVRIPVEIVLLYLFFHKMIPELMTFEGMNYDILAGLTAPIVGLLYIKNKVSNKGLLIWNVIGICLVSLILIIGLLSADFPFQQFAFEQPNLAVNYFPFILLPATIVPVVWYTHMSDIIYLYRK